MQDTKTLESFASKLRKLRKQGKLSQQVVADKLGISQVCIARWETGKHQITLTNLLKLSQALGVSLAEFDSCAVTDDGRGSAEERKRKRQRKK